MGKCENSFLEVKVIFLVLSAFSIHLRFVFMYLKSNRSVKCVIFFLTDNMYMLECRHGVSRVGFNQQKSGVRF